MRDVIKSSLTEFSQSQSNLKGKEHSQDKEPFQDLEDSSEEEEDIASDPEDPVLDKEILN